MREAAEHLDPLRGIFSEHPPAARDTLIALRTYQAELLAQGAYLRVLGSGDLLRHFLSDNDVAGLWAMPPEELIGLWAPGLDLEKAVAGKFFDYLG
ncbi:MAG: hypothetical protein ACREDR_41385 [Blastocatellia bacterium]